MTRRALHSLGGSGLLAQPQLFSHFDGISKLPVTVVEGQKDGSSTNAASIADARHNLQPS